MINRAKLQHILEYAKQQRHIGLHCKVPPEDMVEIVEMAMLQGADGNSPVIPDGWVDCSERMPEDGQEVITHNIFGYRYVSFFDEHSGLFFDRPDGNQMNCIEHILVSHWRPAPAAPQQEVK